MSIEIRRVMVPTDDARELVGELDAELNADYPPEQRHGFDIGRIFQPHISFFVAYLDGRAVGCGGVSFEEGFGELKRMYVRPEARGKNVATALLSRLEDEARAKGVARLTLETGDVRHAAMKLYERAGFNRCGPFGTYLAMSAVAVARSVFFEKQITQLASPA